MNSGIRYKFRQQTIRKVTGQNQREVVFPVFNAIKSVGVVAGEPFSTEWVSKLFGPRVNVHVLEFVGRKREKDEVNSVVYLNDLNFWGLPKATMVETFIATPYDLLLNFTDQNNDAIEFVCAKSVAKFKVSSKLNGKIYDLVITGTSRYPVFLEELKRTLINLNTKI
jgi:hypothetical protein